YRDLTAELARLTKEKKEAQVANVDEDPEVVAAKEKVEERERLLFATYHQASEEFADLHDTSGRMKVIHNDFDYLSCLSQSLIAKSFCASLGIVPAFSDRPQANGVIRSVLSWPHPRNFFISRLRRRLEDEKWIS